MIYKGKALEPTDKTKKYLDVLTTHIITFIFGVFFGVLWAYCQG